MLLVDEALAKFSVILVELEPKKNSWERPQEIFESMNSIGKPLSLADLVRNRLLLNLDAHKQEDVSGCLSRHWHIEHSNLTKNRVKAFANIFCQETKYAITISL